MSRSRSTANSVSADPRTGIGSPPRWRWFPTCWPFARSWISPAACWAYLGLSGLAFGVGIPGTAGAAAAGNAGAFGGEVGEILESAEVVLPGGDVMRFAADDLRLSYRHSALQDPPLKGAVVTEVWLRLGLGEKETARLEVRRIMSERKASQPTGVRSLGSTFKNPDGERAGRRSLATPAPATGNSVPPRCG